MKNILNIIILLFLCNTLFAQISQKQCICSTTEYKQFDFWLGEWEVFNQKGVKVGENKIITMQDSCVIQENWTSSGQTGTSYNFYNKVDSTWNQTYIDNLGTVIELKGTFQNNKMTLKSEKIKSVKSNFYYFNQITWSEDSLGNVSQKWDIIDDKGKILQTAFDGIYKRKTSNNAIIIAPLQKSFTIIEFVKILNNKSEEAFYFYQNNWSVLRNVALKNRYIKSYQLIKLLPDSSSTFDIILITEFDNDIDLKLSEERFQKIIKETRLTGPILLNEIKPSGFRKSVSIKNVETNFKSNQH